MSQEEVVVLEPVAVRYKTAAAALDCSESTIRNLEKQGKLRSIRVGKDRRVTVESLRALGTDVARIKMSEGE